MKVLMNKENNNALINKVDSINCSNIIIVDLYFKNEETPHPNSPKGIKNSPEQTPEEKYKINFR